jgi:hypothetical protein
LFFSFVRFQATGFADSLLEQVFDLGVDAARFFDRPFFIVSFCHTPAFQALPGHFDHEDIILISL